MISFLYLQLDSGGKVKISCCVIPSANLKLVKEWTELIRRCNGALFELHTRN